MNEIQHGLWISDIDTVMESSTQRFDVVISVCQDTCRDNIGVPYPHFPLADDTQSKDNWGGTTDYDVFVEAAERTRTALEDDAVEHVLVHCHVGRNRSAAVCAAALAAYEGSTYDEAFAQVKDARPIANPNDLMEGHARLYVEAYS